MLTGWAHLADKQEHSVSGGYYIFPCSLTYLEGETEQMSIPLLVIIVLTIKL